MPIAAEVTQLEGDNVQLDVSVPSDEVDHAIERALKQLAREVRIPGFRPGKVPPAVVMQRFGREVVVQEMLKSSLGDWYEAAVEGSGVRPIDDPELDLDEMPEGGDLRFRARVRTRPTATLGAHRGLEVGKDEVEVPDEALDAELERLRQRASRLHPVERPAQAGDFVVIDFEGRSNGKRLASATARDYMVELGSERLLPGFDERLQGLAVGETTTLEITYAPDDNRAELRGRTVEYSATVKQVQERVLPELDDDLAAEVSEFDTMDELRADIVRLLTEAAQARVDEAFRRRVIDAVAREATVDIPEVMVERRVGTILAQTAQSMPQGVSFEQYLRATGRTLEQTVEELKPDAEMAIRRELAIEAVAAAEGVEISDEAVDEQVRADAERIGRPADELLEEVRREGAYERLRDDLRLQEAVRIVVEAAVPIPMEQAEAREKLWKPDDEKGSGGGKLWTPGQPQ
jgi:trigger factor